MRLDRTWAGDSPEGSAGPRYSWAPRISRKSWKDQAQELGREIDVIWRVFKDPRTPWYARLVAACAVGYVASPIQLIPSFIPVIGFLDDLVVLAAGFGIVRRLAGAAVVRDCRNQAMTAERLLPSEMRPYGKPVAAIVAGLWLLLTVVATMWLYR
jgi:uncharacterized membrane protein YkvA (DUF1232 family)